MKDYKKELAEYSAKNPRLGIMDSADDFIMCDICDKTFGDNDNECGGFMFQSKMVCPICAPRFMEDVKKYGEEHFIRGFCPPGMMYREWVLNERIEWRKAILGVKD